MKTIHADELYLALDDLLGFERSVGLIKTGKEPLSASDANRGRFLISSFLRECERAGLMRPLDRADRLQHFGEAGRESLYPVDTVKWELKELRIAAFTDLRERAFLWLEDSAEAYYEKSDLFGSLVSQRFPKAAYDIAEAGSCHATGRYTACVFHLMRVAEHGLRALARGLRVPFARTFEDKEWGELIGSIEREIQKIVQKPRSVKRTKELEFYNSAAAQLRYFKDGWRNHVMHTRASYDEHQAMSIMVHVREFMQHLATKVKQ